MTDSLHDHDDHGDEPIDAALAALLAQPAVWAEPDPATEDAVVAAILAESASLGAMETQSAPETPVPAQQATVEPAPVVSLDQRRRWVAPFALGLAAGLLVLAGFGVARGVEFPSGEEADVELALAGTDLAPDATAVAEITETPIGTRIILDVSGLPPAEPGTYYEAWMRTGPEEGVSAGTFHLRGGDGEIELWSGVTPDDYPLITVTIQPEGEPMSSGVVVLAGRLP